MVADTEDRVHETGHEGDRYTCRENNDADRDEYVPKSPEQPEWLIPDILGKIQPGIVFRQIALRQVAEPKGLFARDNALGDGVVQVQSIDD